MKIKNVSLCCYCRPNLAQHFVNLSNAVAKVYPFGIPALYAAILWRNRELLNPRLKVIVVEALPPHADGTEESSGAQFSAFRPASNYGQTGDDAPPAPPQIDLQEFKERVKARKEHPELAPSMFLWRDFGERWGAWLSRGVHMYRLSFLLSTIFAVQAQCLFFCAGACSIGER